MKRKGKTSFSTFGIKASKPKVTAIIPKPSTWNSFATELIHCQSGYGISGCGKNGKDTLVREGFLKDGVVAPQG